MHVWDSLSKRINLNLKTFQIICVLPFILNTYEFIICRLYLNVENFLGISRGKKKEKNISSLNYKIKNINA